MWEEAVKIEDDPTMSKLERSAFCDINTSDDDCLGDETFGALEFLSANRLLKLFRSRNFKPVEDRESTKTRPLC
jgi:hypothetical protein